MKADRITIDIFPFIHSDLEKVYVAECREYNIATQAKTIGAVIARLARVWDGNLKLNNGKIPDYMIRADVF